MKIKLYLSCILLTTFIATAPAQLILNNITEAQLLELLLGEGVEANTLTFDGNSLQRGFFNAQITNLGINSGVVLATGHIFVAVGPNDLTNATEPEDSGCGTPDAPPSTQGPGGLCRPGDTDLDEEYPEYVCSEFNDIFAFLLSGPKPDGGSYNKQNVAIIPDTNLPVAINTVNSGMPPPR